MVLERYLGCGCDTGVYWCNGKVYTVNILMLLLYRNPRLKKRNTQPQGHVCQLYWVSKLQVMGEV